MHINKVMSVKQVHTEAELEAEFKTDGAKLVIVDFFAEWCRPCREVAPYITNLSREMQAVAVFLKVDVDTCNDLSLKYGVKAMPTFILFREGGIVGEIEGANMSQLEEAIAKQLYVS
jgi:thioredoxin 1